MFWSSTPAARDVHAGLFRGQRRCWQCCMPLPVGQRHSEHSIDRQAPAIGRRCRPTHVEREIDLLVPSLIIPGPEVVLPSNAAAKASDMGSGMADQDPLRQRRDEAAVADRQLKTGKGVVVPTQEIQVARLHQQAASSTCSVATNARKCARELARNTSCGLERHAVACKKRTPSPPVRQVALRLGKPLLMATCGFKALIRCRLSFETPASASSRRLRILHSIFRGKAHLPAVCWSPCLP